MSIASAIVAKQQQVADAYTAVSAKGGTLPAAQNLNNLATAIGTISGGGGGGDVVVIPRDIDNGVLKMPTASSYTLPSSVTSVEKGVFYYAFSECPELNTVDMSSLISATGNSFNYAFYRCRNLTSVNFSSLTTISDYNTFNNAFNNCSSLSNIDFSSLTTISGNSTFTYAFTACSSLSTINFPALTTITGPSVFQNAFGSAGITSVSFPVLSTLTGDGVFRNCFRYCSSLTSISFPALTSTSFGSVTNQFSSMLLSSSNVTVHFPSNLQSVIGSWSDVTGGFGGKNTTVLFDLPATA